MNSPPLPYCIARRPAPDRQEGCHVCLHPKVHANEQVVDDGVCRDCDLQENAVLLPKLRPFPTRYGGERSGVCFHLGGAVEHTAVCFWCGHPAHEQTTAEKCGECFDFEARLPKGQVRQWAVGVTTAPRREVVLPRCLENLAAAGWPDATVFAEPESPLEGCTTQHVVARTTRLGAWQNWILGLHELFIRSPRADAYMMVQDDALFCRGVRGYLEDRLWLDAQAAVVSPYCPNMRLPAHDASGITAVPIDGPLIGAVSLIFSPPAVRLLLGDPGVMAHAGSRNGSRHIDEVVGEFLNRAELAGYYLAPSLVDHIGETSAIWNSLPNTGIRSARQFPGASFEIGD